MLTVTEKARQVLRGKLLEFTDNPDVGLRLSPGTSAHSVLVFSREEPGDHVVMHEGAKVLLLAPEVRLRLGNVTMDVEDTPGGFMFCMSLFDGGRTGSSPISA
ncbi:MAG: hypothetical protein PHQ43_06040 [Dehalococcoidales bacterium]|nr:hypothetical protein [Dehalococcoidales bacterium]